MKRDAAKPKRHIGSREMPASSREYEQSAEGMPRPAAEPVARPIDIGSPWHFLPDDTSYLLRLDGPPAIKLHPAYVTKVICMIKALEPPGKYVMTYDRGVYPMDGAWTFPQFFHLVEDQNCELLWCGSLDIPGWAAEARLTGDRA